MEEKDNTRGRKLPDVGELYDVDIDYNVYDWNYASSVLTPELEISLNKYLAGQQCFMVNTINKGRGVIVPQEFDVDCDLYEDHSELIVKVFDEGHSYVMPAGAFGMTTVKYMKSDAHAVIDIDDEEVSLGMTYRRVPLLNSLYLDHVCNDLKSRYLDKVCVFFDHTQSRFSESGVYPGFIGKVKEIEVNGDVSIIDEGKEFFANVRIVCEDVELECNILNLCILEAEYAPIKMDTVDWSDWSDDIDDDFESEP